MTGIRPLQITEIYCSVQGESSYAGLPCSFIRLTGCPLRCRWCDTVYSFKGGQELTIEAIVDQVKRFPTRLVEVTGGEPLAQENCKPLIATLVSEGFKVLLETSGSEPITGVDPACHVIMDIKCPDSKMSDRNLWSNIDALKTTDEIKFVIASRADFDWAKAVIEEKSLTRFPLLMSCAWGLVQPKDLTEWILETGLPCRLNLQLHKYIWGPRAKGV
ncbi:MAG: radical SAM protein [Oligoflexales bacterium]